MSTVNQTTILEQLKELEKQIQFKKADMQSIVDAKETVFKNVAQDMNEKLNKLKAEYIEYIQKIAAAFEDEITELKKQRDDIEMQLFGRVFSDTVVSIHDVYSMIQIAVRDETRGKKPGAVESNAVQEAS